MDTTENGSTSVSVGVKFPFGMPGKTPLTSPTTSTAPKTGINFHHGFPGRENSVTTDRTPAVGTTKHNVSTNTSRGRGEGGGFRGNRGRGRGNNRGRGGNRGNYHNHYNNNNNNNVQLGTEKIEENLPTCEVCDRPKTHIQCFTCGWDANNLRVKTACPKHPKLNFLGDLSICPQCQTAGNLQETNNEEEAMA